MSHSEQLHACRAHKHHAAGDFTLPGAERNYPPDLELEPLHLDIDLRVDLAEEQVVGIVTITVEAQRDGADRIELHAVDFEELSVSDPDGHAIDWRYDGQRIRIAWALPPARGEQRRAAIHYRVTSPTSGLYFSAPTEAYPHTPWFAATDHETERARHWLPCVDLPNARQRLDFHLRAEAGLTILANGALLEEVEHGDGTKTAHWQLDYPCPSYLCCFAVGDFVRFDDEPVAGIPIRYFGCAPHRPEDLQRAFGRTPAMLAWMTEKLDMPLPFPKYYQIALPHFGGAMENISLVSWDDAFVLDETLAREWTRLVDDVNVHEMAHSYFGDAVVCRDFAHAWLKESWATFMEQVWFEDNLGEDERAYQFWRDSQAYFKEADSRYQRPIVTREFNSSWQMYDGHLYPGGACRLQVLRQELGDADFWAGVRAYLKRFAGQVVETDDFRHALEAQTGRSLGRFFDQWFFTAGYPKIKLGFSHDATRGQGSFTVEQTQVDAEKGRPAFQLKTDLGWMVDGQLETRAIEITEARQVFVLPMPKAPEQVRFDPLGRTLCQLEFDPGEPRLKAQLAAADVPGRIQAGLALARAGKRAGIEAIGEALETEPFWGVRADCCEALGEAGAQAAVEILAARVLVEEDPRVQARLMQAAGRYRDPLIAEALEARLDEGDLGYHATAAALQSLGQQRDEAPIDRLLDAADEEGFGGIAQSGAFRALAASRHEEALTALMDRVGYGATSNRSRPAAVTALADLGLRLERLDREAVTETLVDLLRDPSLRVRWAAARGLARLEAVSAIGDITAFAAPLSAQERVTARAIVKGIRDAGAAKPGGKDDAGDKLREQLRKLSDRVDGLEAKLKADSAAESTDAAGDSDKNPAPDSDKNPAPDATAGEAATQPPSPEDPS